MEELKLLDLLLDELREFNEAFWGYELSSKECHMIIGYIDFLEKVISKACEELESLSWYIETISKSFQYEWDYKKSDEWKKELLSKALLKD